MKIRPPDQSGGLTLRQRTAILHPVIINTPDVAIAINAPTHRGQNAMAVA